MPQFPTLFLICNIRTRTKHYIFGAISKRWPFEIPDLLLSENYTVTRLEVAFLMIVSREQLLRKLYFKGTAFLECKTRQVCIYLYISVPVNGETVRTPDHSTRDSETSPVLGLWHRKEVIHAHVLFQWFDWSRHKNHCLHEINLLCIYSLSKCKRFANI